MVWLQFVVGLGDKVAPTDIEEGMRVGCGSFTYRFKLAHELPRPDSTEMSGKHVLSQK